MNWARRQMSATLLPDGTVLAIGGSRLMEVLTMLRSRSLRPSYGLLRSDRGLLWRACRCLECIIRMPYFSQTAVSFPPVGVDLPAISRPTDQPNAQIYSPPYLFNTDGSLAVRPVISSVQTELGYGQSFPISTLDAANVTAVTLVRLGSFTHSVRPEPALQPPHIYALCRACKRSNPGKRHFMPTRPLHALHFREWSSFGGENCSRH